MKLPEPRWQGSRARSAGRSRRPPPGLTHAFPRPEDLAEADLGAARIRKEAGCDDPRPWPERS